MQFSEIVNSNRPIEGFSANRGIQLSSLEFCDTPVILSPVKWC